MKKIKKTSSKNNSSKTGLPSIDLMNDLIFGISVAKGVLATLSLGHQSLWTKKLAKMDQEHLRILLLEAMEGICTAETALTQLKSSPPILLL